MKTVAMDSDFDYRMHPRVSVRFQAGFTYRRVLETAAQQIEAAGAGRIVDPVDAPGPDNPKVVSAWNAWQRRRRVS